jgi:hypothetical protein
LWLFFIGFIHLIQVAVNVFIQFPDGLLELLLVEALGAAVDRFRLAAVDGDQLPAEEFKFLAEKCELLADPSTGSGQAQTDGFPIVPSEVGDGLEVRYEAFDKPHHLGIAMGFPFRLTAGADAVEVAIEIELKQITGVVWRETGFLENGMGEPHLLKIEPIDEGIDNADRVVLGEVVIQGIQKEGYLIPAKAFDMFHREPRSSER